MIHCSVSDFEHWSTGSGNNVRLNQKISVVSIMA